MRAAIRSLVVKKFNNFLDISFQPDSHWDVKHNQSAKGFSTVGAPQMASYNNPSGLYSEENLKAATQGVKG